MRTTLRYIAEGLSAERQHLRLPPELLSPNGPLQPAMARCRHGSRRRRRRRFDGYSSSPIPSKAPAKRRRLRRHGTHQTNAGSCREVRWSDLGTWDALLDVGGADSGGVRGPVEMLFHVRRSDGPLTAVIGVDRWSWWR
jgi:mannose-1-phosphate guanylyltransferase/mannose-6-phosphate isomerase